MRLVALLSYFDEDPAWLTACVSSLSKADVDHLVCCDGPYLLYPDSLRHYRSSLPQHQAIMAAAHGELPPEIVLERQTERIAA